MEALEATIEQDVENSIAAMNAEYESLVADITTYDQYRENADRVKAFYDKVFTDTEALCIRMCEYSIAYAEAVVGADASSEEKYGALDGLYDCLYDDAGEEIYDETYSGFMEDLYDDFYGGVLEDAYEEEPYAEWSDTRTQEYEWWSDTRSDIYDVWSDCRSDIYGFWSDVKSELWGDDEEKVQEEIDDFREDVEKLKSEVSRGAEPSSAPAQAVSQTQAEPTPTPAASDGAAADSTAATGIRPEFQQAMDSYEAFMDEYCAFMEKYSASDGSDLTLLADYADYMSRYADMMEDFEAWDSEEMTTEETLYYIEVQTRINQKLLEAAA